jgi:hypothetical protein
VAPNEVPILRQELQAASVERAATPTCGRPTMPANDLDIRSREVLLFDEDGRLTSVTVV